MWHRKEQGDGEAQAASQPAAEVIHNRKSGRNHICVVKEGWELHDCELNGRLPQRTGSWEAETDLDRLLGDNEREKVELSLSQSKPARTRTKELKHTNIKNHKY